LLFLILNFNTFIISKGPSLQNPHPSNSSMKPPPDVNIY
jgi:hypothetical protein